MDELGWLRLQVEWGVDEALEALPLDRRSATPAVPAARLLTSTPVAPSLPRAAGAVARAQALADEAHTPAALRDALSGFDGCALRATATNLVFADGNPDSSLVLIADVPGPAEDRAGLPFAGNGALFLDRMLASVGMERTAFQAMSLLPWRPPGDRKPADAEIALCLPFLYRHLALVAPNRVVLFGGLATRILLQKEGRRGRPTWQTLHVPGLANGIPALSLPSLAHIQMTPAAKREAWAGLTLLNRAVNIDPDRSSRLGHI